MEVEEFINVNGTFLSQIFFRSLGEIIYPVFKKN